jgi:hypothetical protein
MRLPLPLLLLSLALSPLSQSPVNGADSPKLKNISTRSPVGPSEKAQIAGFVIDGSAPKRVLVRAAGPVLRQYGLTGVLEDPRLELYSGSTVVASNDDWGTNASEVLAAVTLTGAAPFPAGSKDSALVITLNPGAYTAMVTGPGSSSGIALVEVFDADSSDTGSRLANISTRSFVGVGAEAQIAGFVIDQGAPKQVLLRASGPGLVAFGVPGTLANPKLTLYSGSTVVLENDDWGSNAADIYAASKATGAFQFEKGSHDAALLATLAPGAYTAFVTGVNDTQGVALIEAYEVTRPLNTNIAPELLYGASLPYQSTELEDASLVTTNGTRLTPVRTWGTLASEASGRSAVQLKADGDYLEFALPNETDGLVLRYSIPDSADGSAYTAGLSLYIDGVKQPELSLTNKYTWIYGLWTTEGGTKRWSNNPKATPANPHRFFDELIVRLSSVHPAGARLRLVREAANTNFASCASVTLDLAETERIPDPITKPENFVSLTDYGAVADDGQDDTSAMTAALTAVKNSGGAKVGVWIPEGTFHFNTGTVGWGGQGTRIYLDGVSIRGAGQWRSILAGSFAGIYGRKGGLTLSDFRIMAEDTLRDDNNGLAGLEGDFSDSVISHVWIEHAKVGAWITRSYTGTTSPSNLRIEYCRFRDTWADGVNFHKGTSHSTVRHTSIRNCGDDGLAMWSDTYLDTDNSFENNTVQLPNLANGLAIYGGKDNRLLNNYVADTIDNGGGIQYGTNFSPPSLTGSLTISNNAFIRCGSWQHDAKYEIGAFWGHWEGSAGRILSPLITVEKNLIVDSTYSGIFTELPSDGVSITFNDNTLSAPGTYGVFFAFNATGTATFNRTWVTAPGKASFRNDSPTVITGTDNSW